MNLLVSFTCLNKLTSYYCHDKKVLTGFEYRLETEITSYLTNQVKYLCYKMIAFRFYSQFLNKNPTDPKISFFFFSKKSNHGFFFETAMLIRGLHSST